MHQSNCNYKIPAVYLLKLQFLYYEHDAPRKNKRHLIFIEPLFCLNQKTLKFTVLLLAIAFLSITKLSRLSKCTDYRAYTL